MKNLFGISPQTVIGLLAVGLLLAGTQGPWLDFPLSSALYAKDFALPWPNLGQASFRSILILIALLAGVGWLFGLRLVTLSAGFGALLVLSYFFHSWMMNDQWLPRFLAESEQREALQAFLTHYYWPNLNPEPTTTLQSDFEYLPDQVRVFWHASGWGWGFCLAGVILLLLENLFTTPAATLSTLVIVLVSGLAIGTLLYPVVNAEFNHRLGDELLASGRPREAIAAFETALRANPVLQYSDSFVKKSSRAFYQLEGENSLMGGLYLTSFRTQWVTGKPLSKPAGEHLVKSAQILTDVIHSAYRGTLLEMAILHQSLREYSKILIEQGLNAYAEGDLAVSLGLFQEAMLIDRQQLHAAFFQAHVQRELGLATDSIATLKEILGQVEHDSLRADLLCTIGDALDLAHKPLEARAAYMQCLKADSLFNFRAVLDLGGT